MRVVYNKLRLENISSYEEGHLLQKDGWNISMINELFSDDRRSKLQNNCFSFSLSDAFICTNLCTRGPVLWGHLKFRKDGAIYLKYLKYLKYLDTGCPWVMVQIVSLLKPLLSQSQWDYKWESRWVLGSKRLTGRSFFFI